ncbi:MAG: cupin domain-containing protein [Maricaulaceae bacterium]
MRVNADFSQPVHVRTDTLDWTPSPMPGVERRLLDRVGDEVARATSLVRYAPNAEFSAHAHGGGEEFLVLDGVFSDEHGDYPAGSYARNPIGTAHTPRIGPEGCVIFVKLRQFAEHDRAHFVTDTNRPEVWRPKAIPGWRRCDLHASGEEAVVLLAWEAQADRSVNTFAKGAEFLVLDGAINSNLGTLKTGDWLRVPPGTTVSLTPSSPGRLYRKAGHLDPPIHA